MEKCVRLSLLALLLVACTACGSGAESSVLSGGSVLEDMNGPNSAAPLETAEQREAEQALRAFFDAFEKENFDAMKALCGPKTIERCCNWYTEDGTLNWFRMYNGALREIKDVNQRVEWWFPEESTGYTFLVSFRGKTLPDMNEEGEILYPSGTKTISCRFLLQKEDGQWKLTDAVDEWVGPVNTEERQEARQVVLNFFAAAEKENYDTMKTYCTEEFKRFFGKERGAEYWFGLRNVKLSELSLLEDADDSYRKTYFSEQSGYLFQVEMKGEDATAPASWTEEERTQDSSCTLLLRKADDGWKIADLTTEI